MNNSSKQPPGPVGLFLGLWLGWGEVWCRGVHQLGTPQRCGNHRALRVRWMKTPFWGRAKQRADAQVEVGAETMTFRKCEHCMKLS